MKRKMLKAACYISYAIAVILIITYIVFLILGWFEYKELLLNPLVDMGPFSFVIKHWAKKLLIPSAVFVLIGYVSQYLSKK